MKVVLLVEYLPFAMTCEVASIALVDFLVDHSA